MPSTRSGRRTASARANTPPRLWPTIETFWPAVLGEALQAGLQPRAGLLGAADVGADPGAARVVAGRAQPVRHRREAAVAGQEAGDQHHGAALAAGDAVAAEDRAAAQLGQLEPEARLAPQRRDVGDRGQVRHARQGGH